MALVVRGDRGLSWVTGRVVIARVGGALVCAVVGRECVALRRRQHATEQTVGEGGGGRANSVSSVYLPGGIV